MKIIRHAAFSLILSLLCSSIFAQDVDDLFPAKPVEKMIAVAFENMSLRYTSFATQFNFCQQQPKHTDCGDSYDHKRSQYQIAKGNHDVMEQVYSQNMKALLMPEMAYVELVDSLRELAYLPVGPDVDTRYVDTLDAVNEWLILHDMPKTEQVMFLHALMIQAEALNQQIRDEG